MTHGGRSASGVYQECFLGPPKLNPGAGAGLRPKKLGVDDEFAAGEQYIVPKTMRHEEIFLDFP